MSAFKELLVLVSYRSDDALNHLLPMLDEWLEGADRRVSLIDTSASAQLPIMSARMQHVDRVLAHSGPNIGFAAGVNEAASRAVKRWGAFDRIILLNPDVRTEPQVIVGVAAALTDSTVGVVAPMLWMDRGSTRLDRGVARREWSARRLFAEIAGSQSFARLLGDRPRDIGLRTGRGLQDVGFTSGAFMCIRGSLFGDGLSTALPMYYEDQEICARAHEAGLRVVVNTDLNALHEGGSSRKQFSGSQRSIRMLELASAPAMSLEQTSNYSLPLVRAIVAMGGLVRALCCFPLAAVWGVRWQGRFWGNLRLATWFIAWSMRPERWTLTRQDLISRG